MEITELNLIGDFEAGMKRLQNPSLFSKFSPFDLIDKLPQLYGFWKWGALILAIFATSTSVINIIKQLMHQIRAKSVVTCEQSCSQQIYDDDDFDSEVSDDNEGGDTPSSVKESDDEIFDSEDYQKPGDEVFRAEGYGCYWGNIRGHEGDFTLRRRNGFSWSDFSAGKSVVQQWDSLGLGLDFEDGDHEYESEVAIRDLNRVLKVSSGRWWCNPAAAANVVLTAEINNIDGGGGLDAYDDRKSPAIYEAWRPRQGKVYVKDNGAMVGSVTESDRKI